MLLKKYMKTKTSVIAPDTRKTIMKYIIDNNIIIYGGLGLDLLLRANVKAIQNEETYYKDENFTDFDVMVSDPYKQSLELAAILGKTHEYVRIVTGLTGETRKIFIDLSSAAIIDMSPIPKKLTEIGDKTKLYVEIKTNSDIVRVLNPQFMKEDQYKNMCTNLFSDYHRMEKSQKKIDLLEKYFPISDNIYKIMTYKYNEYISELNDLPNNVDCIYGGDFAFNIYYPDKAVPDPEIILYCNECLPRKYFSKILVVPWEGATLFKWTIFTGPNEVRDMYDTNKRDRIRLISRNGLLRTYYQRFSETRDDAIKKKIAIMVASNDHGDDKYDIESPKVMPEVPWVESMPTIWMVSGKIIDHTKKKP
jgi:hypothetical protein